MSSDELRQNNILNKNIKTQPKILKLKCQLEADISQVVFVSDGWPVVVSEKYSVVGMTQFSAPTNRRFYADRSRRG